jgi:hypothetical protein
MRLFACCLVRILNNSCLLVQTIDNDQPYLNDNGCKNKFWGKILSAASLLHLKQFVKQKKKKKKLEI